MGVKTRSRLCALFVALVMVFTSASGVFAAGSSQQGTKKKAVKTVVTVTTKSVKVATNGKFQYKINNGKWKKSNSSKTIKAKSGSRVAIKTSKGTVYRWIKSTKITKAKKNNLKWKKVKGAKYYMVKIVKNGKTTFKKVKGTKLKKGVTKGATVQVRPVLVKGGKTYLGALCGKKKIK